MTRHLRFLCALATLLLLIFAAPKFASAEPQLKLTVTVEPATVGNAVRGKGTITATGVEKTIEVSAGIVIQYPGVSGRGSNNVSSPRRLVFHRDETMTFDLTNDFPVMVTSPEPKQMLVFLAYINGSEDEDASSASAVLNVSGDVVPGDARVTNLSAIVLPQIPKVGNQIELKLDYRIFADEKKQFDLKQRVTLAKLDTSGIKNPQTMEHSEKVIIDAPNSEYSPLRQHLEGLIFTVQEPGDYLFMYELTGPGMTKMSNTVPLRVAANNASRKGRLTGTATVKKPVIKPGEDQTFTVEYKMIDGPDEAQVTYSAELNGPSYHSDQIQNTMVIKPEDENTFRGRATLKDEGTYTFHIQITGDNVEEWNTDVTFEVKSDATPTPIATVTPNPTASPNATTTTGSNPAKGTWGLVKKEVGYGPPATDVPGQGFRISADITEGHATFKRDPLGPQYNFKSYIDITFDTPPSVLKPGEIIELHCKATGELINSDGGGAGGSFYAEGMDILERKSSDVYGVNGKTHSGDDGFIKLKIPGGSSRDIKILQITSGFTFSTGNWNPCVYTYRWEAPPITTTPTPVATATASPSPTETPTAGNEVPLHWVDSDSEDRCNLSASLDISEITLIAGEIGQSVHVSIEGFRKRTEDRVQVIFPQALDGWASLPGQIVVSMGNGSYWPPMMDRPKHTDVYFFSARSTAPTGDQTIQWIVQQEGCRPVTLTLLVHVKGKNVCPPKNFAGTWKTNFGTMVLTQTDDVVTGTYDNPKGSTIAGKVFCDTLRFEWIQPTAKGSGYFKLGTDGNSFLGPWNSTRSPDAAPEGWWDGTFVPVRMQ